MKTLKKWVYRKDDFSLSSVKKMLSKALFFLVVFIQFATAFH